MTTVRNDKWVLLLLLLLVQSGYLCNISLTCSYQSCGESQDLNMTR